MPRREPEPIVGVRFSNDDSGAILSNKQSTSAVQGEVINPNIIHWKCFGQLFALIISVTMRSAMRREPVDSSTLASVGYDETQFLLELEFRRGELFQYFGPPHNIHPHQMTAETQGRFV